MSMNLIGRHPSTNEIARHFAYEHLPLPLQAVSKPCQAALG
jgi:hypothetical protein